MQPHFLRLGQHLVNLANGASLNWKAGNTLEINFVGGTSPLVFYRWQAEAQALLRW